MAATDRLDVMRDVVPLSQLPHSSRDQHALSVPDSDNDIVQDSRLRESERQRILVLVGSALSQLPIWGTPHLSACIKQSSQPQVSL
jgi:hypothetical protein